MFGILRNLLLRWYINLALPLFPVAQRRLLPQVTRIVPLSSRSTPAAPGPVLAVPPELASLQRGVLCSPGATMQVCNTKETECFYFNCLFSEFDSSGNYFVLLLCFKTFPGLNDLFSLLSSSCIWEGKKPTKLARLLLIACSLSFQ